MWKEIGIVVLCILAMYLLWTWLGSEGPRMFVFRVRGDGTGLEWEEAQQIAQKLGVRVATWKDMENAWNQGAHWCEPAWTLDKEGVACLAFVAKDASRAGCGKHAGVNTVDATVTNAVNLYGNPPRSPTDGEVVFVAKRK